MKLFLPLVLLLLVPTQALAQSENADALRKFVGQYEDSWQSHDAENLGRFFADDADMLVGIQPRIVGRDAIAEWWDGYFSHIDSGRLLTISIESIQLLGPNVALINVETTTGGNHSETNEVLESRQARGTWVVTRSSGNWQIAALRAHSPVGELRVAPGTDK
ncbi:MAG: SgcJ/EcaC family oxidoreductase [Woeseiaceae bacterium]